MAKDTIVNPWQELEEQVAKDFPKAWIWDEDGEMLKGIFLRLERGMTRDYGPAYIAIVKTEDGSERSLFLFHTALKTQFVNLKPPTGSMIVVKRGKKRESRSGMKYYDFRVATDTQNQSISWDEIANSDPVPADADDIPF